MQKLKKENAISILVFLLSTNCFSQGSMSSPRYEMSFPSCDAAFVAAKFDVKNQTIRYFDGPVNYNYAYTKELRDLKLRQAALFDSLMYSMHRITVNRETDMTPNDFTRRCYNTFIIKHMDTTYCKLFTVEILNQVAELTGDRPFDPNWVKLEPEKKKK